MLWQYRTILFEFTKDGLLGDKYVDDEDMEKTLNQLGGQSWELVDVTLLQDGVLAFLKRPAGEEMMVEEVVEAQPAAPPTPIIKPRSVAAVPKVIEVEQIQKEDEPLRGLERQRKPTLHNDDSDFIGGIKIS